MELNEEVVIQYEEVMKIHDEVMPKMVKLGKLVGQLKPMADSLGVDSPQAKAMQDLQEANKAMMDWMQDFGDYLDYKEIFEIKELTPEKLDWLEEQDGNNQKWLNEERQKLKREFIGDRNEKLVWLRKEEGKVKEVKEKINSSIANAEALLDQN